MALIGGYKANCHVESRGFPRTVRPEETHYLSLLHFHAYALYHRACVVAFYKVVRAQSHGASFFFRIHSSRVIMRQRYKKLAGRTVLDFTEILQRF